MTYHSMVLSEPDSANIGFIRRYYATIDISQPSTSCFWRQIDANGNYVGSVSASFPTVDDAKNDALHVLNGDRWE